MDIVNTINELYYQMTLYELRLLNKNPNWGNVSYNSRMYLDLIAYQQNCTVSFLAKALNISKPAVTMKVNELVRQGLVTKTQSTADKRVYYLHVNREERERIHSFDEWMALADARVRERFSEREREVFCQILYEVSGCLAAGGTNE